MIALFASIGFAGPELLDPNAQTDALGRLSAIVSVDEVDRTSVATQLTSLGAEVRRTPSGTLVGSRRTLVIRASEATLKDVDEAGIRVRLARSMDPEQAPPPLDATGHEVGARALGAVGRPQVGSTGEGLVLANIDAGIDIYHPHFYRADAGSYAWVDVDGNGTFESGVDAIDVNGDGQIGNREIARVLDGWTTRFDFEVFEQVTENLDGELDPAYDWVYVDRNNDGQRDIGDATKPAFGEPLFVPDDANGNGVLDLEERLIRLGSPIIKALWARGRIYQGAELVEYEPGAFIGHSTSVTGILAGGQLPLQRPTVGLAPDADVVLMDRSVSSDADILEFMSWAPEQGARVVLHEYNYLWDTVLGGEHPIEQLIEEQVDDDALVHVCPAGNLADAGRHTVEDVVAGQDVAFRFVTDRNVPDPTVFFYLLFPNGLGDVTCGLELKGLDAIPVTFDGKAHEVGRIDHRATWVEVDGPGDALEITASGLEVGEHSLTCRFEGVEEPVHAFLIDSWTSWWSRGAVWEHEVRANTMLGPSTHPHCLAVAAHGGRWPDFSGDVGRVRTYSGEGPRPDGLRTIDLSAPDDPFAPNAQGSEILLGGFGRFGGTSGASPHVAATAGLVSRIDPTLSAHEIRQRLIDAAIPTGEPEHLVGAGQLEAWGAVFDDPRPEPPVPSPVSVTVHGERSGDQCQVELRAHALAYPDASFRWDLDYDGVWDTDWGAGLPVDNTFDGLVRVDAAADGYRVGGVVQPIRVDPQEACRRQCGCASGTPLTGAAGFLLLLPWLRRRRAA
ncbi:MAG: S8 family serine peptidase [Myxococcota bacterium]